MQISGEDTSKKENKVEEEIDYLDVKITSLIDRINGINLQNYKMSISKVEETESGNSAGDSEGGEEQKNDSKKEETQEGEESKKETRVTKMENEQTITNNQEVNWQWLSGETEVFYSVWVTIILDLYDINIQTEKILRF